MTPLRLILPLLLPTKSFNDSHASDTPPSLFSFFLSFTVSTKEQIREIHRHAFNTVSHCAYFQAHSQRFFFFTLLCQKLVIIYSQLFKTY